MSEACCAHTRIEYLTIYDGTTRCEWRCALCRVTFRPAPPPPKPDKLALAMEVVRYAKSVSAFVKDIEDAWPDVSTNDRLDELIGGLFASVPLLRDALARFEASDAE